MDNKTINIPIATKPVYNRKRISKNHQ